jgi:hypothetical protein
MVAFVLSECIVKKFYREYSFAIKECDHRKLEGEKKSLTMDGRGGQSSSIESRHKVMNHVSHHVSHINLLKGHYRKCHPLFHLHNLLGQVSNNRHQFKPNGRKEERYKALIECLCVFHVAVVGNLPDGWLRYGTVPVQVTSFAPISSTLSPSWLICILQQQPKSIRTQNVKRMKVATLRMST